MDQRTLPLIIYPNNIDEDGTFRCDCGTVISPDDTTCAKYIVLDSVMYKHTLEKVVVKCLTCSSEIHVQLTEPHRSFLDRSFDFAEDLLKRHRGKRVRAVVLE